MLLNGGKEKLLVAVIVFLVLIIASIALAPVHAYLYNGPFMSLWCWLFGC